jgi:pseudaminic acid cytidylyltransferase
MTIAIIPARGGSKRIKNKNIIDFCGKPMIAYALDAANRADIFEKIHVSTESPEIKTIVEGLGYKVDFMRPDELADDFTGIIPVLKWVLDRYREEELHFEDVCCLMPVCPLIEPDDIVRGYKHYMSHDRKYPLHCVAPFPVPVEWAFRRDHKGFLIPVSPGAFAVRSQNLEKAYYECGPFSFFHKTHILGDDSVGDKGFVSIVIPRDRSVDIDEPDDLLLVEKLYLGKMALARKAL